MPDSSNATLPPVGATVVDGYGNLWTREEQSYGPGEEAEPGWWRPCTFGHRCAEGEHDGNLTSLWREQQARIAAEQARDSINTEAEMWMREVRERDKTIAALHDEVTSALAERNYAHERAEEAEARVVELEAKVAAFEVGTEAGRQIRALEAEVARLREDTARLAQYAEHWKGCGTRHPDTNGPECSCGLTEALNRMARAAKVDTSPVEITDLRLIEED